MDFKYRFPTIGFNTVIPGKLKELMFNTKSILEVKFVKPLTIRVIKDLIGNKHKQS